MSNRTGMALLSAVLLMACGSIRGSEKLDKEVNLLVKGLRSERLKEQATNHAAILKDKDASARACRDAANFFYDLKAKGVLAALLELEASPIQDHLFLQCLDAFGVEDIVRLHDAAAAYAKRPVARLGSDEAQRQDIVDRLLLRTARILGLKPKGITSYTRDDIRAWFVNALRTAQEEKTAPAAVADALKILEAAKKKD